jgi:hypothetical protein
MILNLVILLLSFMVFILFVLIKSNSLIKWVDSSFNRNKIQKLNNNIEHFTDDINSILKNSNNIILTTGESDFKIELDTVCKNKNNFLIYHTYNFNDNKKIKHKYSITNSCNFFTPTKMDIQSEDTSNINDGVPKIVIDIEPISDNIKLGTCSNNYRRQLRVYNKNVKLVDICESNTKINIVKKYNLFFCNINKSKTCNIVDIIDFSSDLLIGNSNGKPFVKNVLSNENFYLENIEWPEYLCYQYPFQDTKAGTTQAGTTQAGTTIDLYTREEYTEKEMAENLFKRNMYSYKYYKFEDEKRERVEYIYNIIINNKKGENFIYQKWYHGYYFWFTTPIENLIKKDDFLIFKEDTKWAFNIQKDINYINSNNLNEKEIDTKISDINLIYKNVKIKFYFVLNIKNKCKENVKCEKYGSGQKIVNICY